MNSNATIPLILADSDEVARAAADRIAEAGRLAIEERGEFRLALSGGRTPARLYRLLAFGSGGPLDWGKVVLLFSDERSVPPDHRDSNYRLVRESLLDPLRVPEAHVYRMRAERGTLEEAAAEYEPHLRTPLDLLLLGVGEDGHTASLFPGSPLLDERDRRVAAVLAAPKPPPRRLTLTPRAISEARAVLVLATGAEKAGAVARALAPEGDTRDCPARLVRYGAWLLDRGAAEALSDPR